MSDFDECGKCGSMYEPGKYSQCLGCYPISMTPSQEQRCADHGNSMLRDGNFGWKCATCKQPLSEQELLAPYAPPYPPVEKCESEGCGMPKDGAVHYGNHSKFNASLMKPSSPQPSAGAGPYSFTGGFIFGPGLPKGGVEWIEQTHEEMNIAYAQGRLSLEGQMKDLEKRHDALKNKLNRGEVNKDIFDNVVAEKDRLLAELEDIANRAYAKGRAEGAKELDRAFLISVISFCQWCPPDSGDIRRRAKEITDQARLLLDAPAASRGADKWEKLKEWLQVKINEQQWEGYAYLVASEIEEKMASLEAGAPEGEDHG